MNEPVPLHEGESMDDRITATPFGPELRRWRLGAGLSLTALARRVNYSRGHLSKIENGVKPPTPELARGCDAALDAAGALAGLVPAGPRRPTGDDQPAAGEVWTMTVGPHGSQEFGTREHQDGPTDTFMRWGPAGPGGQADLDTIEVFRSLFAQLRQLGQTLGPSYLTPLLISHTVTLQTLARRAPAHTRAQLLVLAARFAEYTGWMAQEKGDDRAATWWTDCAVKLAEAGHDDDMTNYAFVRRALIALYRHDALATIELAGQAVASTSSSRVRALAAQRQAQGHAIAGDERECWRALDLARRLMAEQPPTDPATVLGTSNVADPVAIVTGWCLHDLGRPAEAAVALSDELDRIPARAERARARYGIRLALSLASVRELEQAQAVADPILDTMPRIDSATIRADLGLLARTLNRWHGDPVVRDIMPKLTRTLRCYTVDAVRQPMD
jgi:hypothetical protein